MEIKQNTQFGAVFDFDGTLVDSFTKRKLAHIVVAKILIDYEKKQGFKVDTDAMVLTLSNLEKEMTMKWVYDRRIWFLEAVKRNLKTTLHVPKEVLSKAVLGYWNTIIKHTFPYTGTIELLNSLKQSNIRLGLISDTDGLKGMKHTRIKQSKMEKFFDAIVISGETTRQIKPHPYPFKKICGLLKVSPENCVYVGDNPKVDVLGAKRTGMKTIIVRNSSFDFNSTQVNPDRFLAREAFSELESLIYNLLEK